jgi:uncharacterized membrane protein
VGITLKVLMVALAIAYPAMAHWAAVSRSVAVTVASVALLATLVLLPRLVARSVVAWVLVPIVIAGLWLLARTNAAWLPLYATPVLINLFAAWVFGHTLAPGQVPLIERLARLMHEPDGISAEIASYARNLTLAWAVFLVGLALLSLTLALLAAPDGILLMMGVQPPVTVPLQVWSLFANFLNYLIAGAFFLAEYIYRQHRFPQQPYRNLIDFLRRARRLGPRVLGQHVADER